MTRGKLFWRTTFSRNYQYGSFFSKQRVKQNWRSWRCNSNFQPLQLLNTASKSWKYPQLAEMFQHLCCVEWPLKNLAMLDSKGALKKVLSKYQEILLDFNLNLNEKCHNLQPQVPIDEWALLFLRTFTFYFSFWYSSTRSTLDVWRATDGRPKKD